MRLDAVRAPVRPAVIHHIRQREILGLGHAVLCARRHVGEQPFTVLLGDDPIDPRETLLSRPVQLYGCAAVEPTGEGDARARR